MVISYVFCILISLLLLAVLGRVDDYVVYIIIYYVYSSLTITDNY